MKRRRLPCFPCPHGSACCRYGVDLSEQEAHTLKAIDPAFVIRTENGPRTAVDAGGCVFLKNNSCTIHDKPHYPVVCAAFPWNDVEGGPYQGDLTICPAIGECDE